MTHNVPMRMLNPTMLRVDTFFTSLDPNQVADVFRTVFAGSDYTVSFEEKEPCNGNLNYLLTVAEGDDTSFVLSICSYKDCPVTEVKAEDPIRVDFLSASLGFSAW